MGVSLNILAADDHPVNQELVSLLVKKLGHQVDLVSNGKEAFKALQHKAFALVLMDCQMPEMDGYEATKAIREWEGPGRHTPIIASNRSCHDWRSREMSCRWHG